MCREYIEYVRYFKLIYDMSCSTSLPGGNQVDGLPPVCIRDLSELAGVRAGERLSMIFDRNRLVPTTSRYEHACEL